MFIYPVNPSPANVLRGRLKHSWLENEVRDKSVEDVLELWKLGAWPALSRFPAQVEDAVALSRHLESGFSPVVLLDAWRKSRKLSDKEETWLDQARESLHQYFLADSTARSVTVDLAELISEKAERVGAALEALLEAWERPRNGANRERLKSCWKEFAARADELYELISRIPAGVAIP